MKIFGRGCIYFFIWYSSWTRVISGFGRVILSPSTSGVEWITESYHTGGEFDSKLSDQSISYNLVTITL